MRGRFLDATENRFDERRSSCLTRGEQCGDILCTWQTTVRPISREKIRKREREKEIRREEGYKRQICRRKAANVRRMCLTLDIDCPSWRFLFRAAGLLATATTTDDPMTTTCNPRDFNIILPGWQHVRAGTFDIAKPRVIVRLSYRLVAEYRFRWIYAARAKSSQKRSLALIRSFNLGG